MVDESPTVGMLTQRHIDEPVPPDHATRVELPSALQTGPAADSPGAPIHEVSIVDFHRFTQAVCSCGWVSAARRARNTARTEGHDHALLYAAVADPKS